MSTAIKEKYFTVAKDMLITLRNIDAEMMRSVYKLNNSGLFHKHLDPYNRPGNEEFVTMAFDYADLFMRQYLARVSQFTGA